MERVRIGVIGAGGIAQVEHVPNLLRLPRHFKVLGICDPSRIARDFMTERYGISAYERLDDLLALPLDAVLIASPDALHKEHVLAALKQGLHVFCEKPLCYGAADIAALIRARDTAGRALQVGYMKRFDPSYETALRLLPGSAKTLRHISVEVNDPDAWPFVRHHEVRRGDDAPENLIHEVATKQEEQAARAIGLALDKLTRRGFCGAYASAIVHDVNAVHGILDTLEIPDGEIVGAQLYAGGDGGHGSVRLLDGKVLWTMTHLTAPGLPAYSERISLVFDDASLELEFPSPYLNHQPTRLTIKTADGHNLHSRDIRSGFEEAFIEELKGFWSAIADGSPVRNTAEHATRDMNLLCGLACWHLKQQSLPYSGVSA